MPEDDIDALVDVLLGEAHREVQEDEELAALLTGPFQAVRDQNYVEADCVPTRKRSASKLNGDRLERPEKESYSGRTVSLP
jgi:hypothetical protein